MTDKIKCRFLAKLGTTTLLTLALSQWEKAVTREMKVGAGIRRMPVYQRHAARSMTAFTGAGLRAAMAWDASSASVVSGAICQRAPVR